MEVTSDVRAEIVRLQEQIQNYLGLNSSSLLFEYREIDNRTRLDLITVNPRHSQRTIARAHRQNHRPEIGDWRPETGDRLPESGDQRPK